MIIYMNMKICYKSCPNSIHISSDNHSCEIEELINIEARSNYSNIIGDSTLGNEITDTQSSIQPSEKGLIYLESSFAIYNEIDKMLIHINTNDTQSYISIISSEIDSITNKKSLLVPNQDDFFDGKLDINDSDPSVKDEISKNIKEDIQNKCINFINLVEGDKKDLNLKENDIIY